MTKARAKPAAPWSREKAGRDVHTRIAGWADPYIDRLLADCHPRQRDAVEDPAIRVSVLCPGRAGKTTAAETRLLITMLRKPRAQVLFLAVTKRQAENISWKKFKRIFENLGVKVDAAEVKQTITIEKNGSTLLLAGSDDRKEIGKLRGIPWDGVVLDEAALPSPKLLEDLLDDVLGPRMGERDGWIMMVSTPGHRRSGPYYEATRPGGTTHRPYAERDDPKWAEHPREWSSHGWTLEEAARHVDAARKAWQAALALKATKQWPDNDPTWMREFLGLWADDDSDMMFNYRPHDSDGQPFNQWTPELAGPMRIAVLPPDVADNALFVYAFDKGFKDNFATNIFAFSSTDPQRRIFHVYNAESPGMSCRTFARLLLGARDDEPEQPRIPDEAQGLIGATGWPVAVVGDVDDGFLKDLLEVYFVPAKKADKKLESKVTTIEEIKGDLAARRILVLAGSPLEQQMIALQWVPDEFGGVKEDKSAANHSADCLVYARRVIAPLFEVAAAAPPPPADDEEPAPAKAKPGKRPRPEPMPAAQDWDGMLASATYEEPW